jgi:small subunit ribosomal protein S15
MREEAQKFVTPFKRHEKDNGSPEVQIALLSYEVEQLQLHLKEHKSDVDAKRSLLKKVARRRKFLRYLKENEIERYTLIANKLKLKV